MLNKGIPGYDDQSEGMRAMISARSGMLMNTYFLAHRALKLQLVEDANCRTAWTDGNRLGFNPAWIAGLKKDEVKGLVIHEVYHVIMNHHLRLKGRNPKLWNRAADYVINLLITQAGYRIPEGGLLSQKYRNMATEEVYALLVAEEEAKKQAEAQAQQPQQGQGGESGQDGQAGESQEDDDQGTDSEDGQDDGQGNGPASQEEIDGPEGWGEVRQATMPDGREMTEAEVEAEEAKNRVDIIQGMNMARARGQLPGAMEEALKQHLAPKSDLKAFLLSFVDRAARNDYSWQRPNRSYLQRGLYVPSLYSKEVPECFLIMDTSGSTWREVEKFGELISGVLEEFDTICRVLYVDTAVRGDMEEFTRDDLPLQLSPRGGGGTDFRPGFEWIEKEGYDPQFVIYLTDLACSSYPEEPDYPVLWAKIGSWSCGDPPFGEVMEIVR